MIAAQRGQRFHRLKGDAMFVPGMFRIHHRIDHHRFDAEADEAQRRYPTLGCCARRDNSP